ncbi:hypothetical protein STEG23_029375, partial [Scotinomys teguina]
MKFADKWMELENTIQSETGSLCIALNGIELSPYIKLKTSLELTEILMPLLPKCWDKDERTDRIALNLRTDRIALNFLIFPIHLILSLFSRTFT